MEQLVLRQDIVDTIKSDPVLYGHVAKIAGYTILSMKLVLDKNTSSKLVQPTVLRFLSEYLSTDQDDLLEPILSKERSLQ